MDSPGVYKYENILQHENYHHYTTNLSTYNITSTTQPATSCYTNYYIWTLPYSGDLVTTTGLCHIL